MKRKLPFYKKAMALVIFFFLLIPLALQANGIDQKNSCIVLTNDVGIRPLLHSIGPVHQIINNDTNTTITESGSYHILENITSIITIDADDVFIDLNGFFVTGEITIKEGHKNIHIQNGSLVGGYDFTPWTNCEVFENLSQLGLDSGIVLEKGTKNIFLQNLCIKGYLRGILFAGEETVDATDNSVTCCKVANCFITDCGVGFLLFYTNNSVFEYCDTCCCVEAGFELNHCQSNKINKCKSVRTGNNKADLNAYSFVARSGRDNLFYECMAEGTYKCINSLFCTKAVGFAFGCIDDAAGETESKIINCFVDSISSADVGNAVGIRLESCIKTDLSGCAVISGNFGYNEFGQAEDISDIAWSPTGDKIAMTFIGDDAPIKVFQFDCCTWSEIFTSTDITNADNRHLEWDPTGRYLAIASVDGSNAKATIYDTAYKTVFSQDLDMPGNDSYNPVWSRDSNYVVFLKSSVVGQIYVFKKSDDTWINIAKKDFGSSLTSVAITPDEKFLSLTDNTGEITVYNWSWDFGPEVTAPDTSNLTDLDTVQATLSGINDSAWCPIACNGKYYLVTVGKKGAATPFSNIEIFEFDGVDSLGSIMTDSFDDELLRVKWAPNGKYFAVLGTNGSAALYEFTPELATPVATQIKVFSLGYPINSGGIDWSPSGRYFILGGDVQASVPDFAVYEVANVSTKSMIANNKIANVNGGICGIGIEGSGACNAIMQNICYECDLNFSQKVLDVWYCGLVGMDQTHYNVAIPPY